LEFTAVPGLQAACDTLPNIGPQVVRYVCVEALVTVTLRKRSDLCLAFYNGAMELWELCMIVLKGFGSFVLEWSESFSGRFEIEADFPSGIAYNF
jgi:hypothetical protein